MILSYIRTVLLYLILIAVIRLMGKRQVGQMAPSEFVVTMLVANLAAIPMQDAAIPLYSGLVPILTVLGVELVLSWLTLRSLAVRKLLCGRPVILIDNGVLRQERLRSTRISLDELMGHLREKDVLDIGRVQYAILETDGTLSVFPYPESCPASAEDAGIAPSPQYLPVILIADGQLLENNLAEAGRDRAWLSRILEARSTCVSATALLTADASGRILWIGKEDGPCEEHGSEPR